MQRHFMLQQGSKLQGFRISETPKDGDGNPNVGAGFLTKTQELRG